MKAGPFAFLSGMDYAVNRDYQTGIGKFAQPDRIQGIITNPQTLNRYSYVTNDPINYVDPLGLFQGPIGDGPTSDPVFNWVDYFGWGGTGGGPLPRYMPMMSLGNEGMGGGLQLVAFNKTPARQQNDCYQFADMVQELANTATSVRGFLDSLASTFTAANDSSISEMRRASRLALPPGRPTFGDSGFKLQFRDPSNQVRHFIGGFIAGADLGGFTALQLMNYREEPNTNSVNDADIRLNAVSTDLGSIYGTGFMIGIGTIRKELADQIRRRVCE